MIITNKSRNTKQKKKTNAQKLSSGTARQKYFLIKPYVLQYAFKIGSISNRMVL